MEQDTYKFCSCCERGLKGNERKYHTKCWVKFQTELERLIDIQQEEINILSTINNKYKQLLLSFNKLDLVTINNVDTRNKKKVKQPTTVNFD